MVVREDCVYVGFAFSAPVVDSPPVAGKSARVINTNQKDVVSTQHLLKVAVDQLIFTPWSTLSLDSMERVAT